MVDETTTETTTPDPSDTSPPGEPVPTEEVSAEPEAPPPPPKPASKVLTIPTSKIGEIKKAERERGRLETQRQYDVVAKELGYDSHEQLMTALQQQRAQGTSPAASQEADPDDFVETPVAPEPETDPALRRSRRVQALSKENAQLLDKQRRANRQRAHEERQRKALQEKLDAQKAEHELQIAALRAGVTDDDVDYAVNCLRKEIRGKSADDLKDFDPSDYFGKKLRKTKPYLYGVTTREATTSPPPEEAGTNGGPPAPADPSVQTGGQEAGNPVDALKMSQEEYSALLRKRGLQLPSVGMPV